MTDSVELVVKFWAWREPQFASTLEATREACGLSAQESPAVTVIADELDRPAMRELYLSARVFIKNANREVGLPATEAVACGVRVAASEAQLLRSHLPVGTRWFTPGDVAELSYLLHDEYRSYRDAVTVVHRHTWQNTGAWVHRHLRSLMELS